MVTSLHAWASCPFGKAKSSAICTRSMTLSQSSTLRDVEELLDDEVSAIMVDHEPTTTGTGVLVNKLVVVDQHVHCTCLDDKHVDAHGKLG